MANHNPVIQNTLPTWVFIQNVANDEHRHEIRRVPKGFRVYCNVSEANGGGCSFPHTFATYKAAFEMLEHFRQGSKLTERINGAGDIENY